MKKFASLVGVGALILASAGGVFAYDVKVINKGDARQEIATMATAISGDVKLSVKDNKHFGKIKLGGGEKTTGFAGADSLTEAWANIFDVKVH